MSLTSTHVKVVWMSAVILLVMILASNLAFAHTPLGIGASDTPVSVSTGPFAGLMNKINQYQQDFYRALRTALIAMREEPQKLWWLIAMSFAYGIFHAAGPGHGKVIIASYIVANDVQLKRGVLLSFIAAIAQGLMAVLVVGATWFILRRLGISTTQTTFGLELASYGLIVAIGLWLLWRKAKSYILARIKKREMTQDGHGHHHTHHDGHHDHSHSADGTCNSCGHAHMPSPAALSKELSLKDAWSVIMAVGIRPCSGAIIVLTFSLLNGLYMGGILSVFAMAIGTAITVSLLATLAVSAKTLALRFADGTSGAHHLGALVEIFGALLIILFGVTLMMAALN